MQVPEEPHSISGVEHLFFSMNFQSRTVASTAPARMAPRAKVMHSAFLVFEEHIVLDRGLGCLLTTTAGVEACVCTLGAYWGTEGGWY